ncbi:hypothetical protein AC249_AIPGENE17345 [Exaiptasia diaphana]|nr:hypothetical protein AC249_AIPGENE17345 [Exaiptasia diaphana]
MGFFPMSSMTSADHVTSTDDKPSTTTTISILTSTVTLPSTLPENKTKNQTGFSVIPTPTKLISRVPVTNSTSTASDEISEADQWKLPVIIIGCIVGLCVMIVGVIICCYRWYSSRSRNEDTTQGLFRGDLRIARS